MLLMMLLKMQEIQKFFLMMIFFEDFSNNINNFCIFALSLPR